MLLLNRMRRRQLEWPARSIASRRRSESRLPACHLLNDRVQAFVSNNGCSIGQWWLLRTPSFHQCLWYSPNTMTKTAMRSSSRRRRSYPQQCFTDSAKRRTFPASSPRPARSAAPPCSARGGSCWTRSLMFAHKSAASCSYWFASTVAVASQRSTTSRMMACTEEGTKCASATDYVMFDGS